MNLRDVSTDDLGMWFGGTWANVSIEDEAPKLRRITVHRHDEDEASLTLRDLYGRTTTVDNADLYTVDVEPIGFTPSMVNTAYTVGAVWLTRSSYSRRYRRSLATEGLEFMNRHFPTAVFSGVSEDTLLKEYLLQKEYPSPIAARARLLESNRWATAFSPHFSMSRSMLRKELLLNYKNLVVGVFPFSPRLGTSIANRCVLDKAFTHLAEELAPYVSVEISNE